jgi:tRNA-splicing ligase RtcB
VGIKDKDHPYKVIEGGHVHIKAWVKGVPVGEEVTTQLQNTASLRIIHKHIAVMPDCHFGLGATIGSVVPTVGAVIPAAVGVDIGCGMMAVKTGLGAEDLPEDLGDIRQAIEAMVPHGFGKDASHTRGGWEPKFVPEDILRVWNLGPWIDRYDDIQDKHPGIKRGNDSNHLGTLGSGNHFIEICLDENERVWIMLHSGSRGIGNRIGRYFIELAKEDMCKFHINLPDKNLAYFPEGTDHFDDYMKAVGWAQDFARINREIMMDLVTACLYTTEGVPLQEAMAQVEKIQCQRCVPSA